MLEWHSTFDQMNAWGTEKKPFIFILDFLLNDPIAIPLEDAADLNIYYDVNGVSNSSKVRTANTSLELESLSIDINEYSKGFDTIYKHLRHGNSYLTNYTCSTKLKSVHTLSELYYISSAKYKLKYRDHFIVFSPETFIQISNGQIFSYPMKGTIDASIENAADIILSDPKEMAEHATIVDLIRNDLSKVAKNVNLRKYRYVETLNTSDKTLLQVSSEVVGDLEKGYQSRLGDILFDLLPAGSISGAPKPKTLDIILEAETHDRGHYTGVFGIFDGTTVDSGVMIRYIEKRDDGLYYKSGGGITYRSNMKDEYEEMKQKIYVPLH